MNNQWPILALFFCGVIAFWGFCMLKVTTSSLPYNPISMSKNTRSNIKMLIPQGWAFFTKDPREPSVGIYQARAGALQMAIPPNASAKNLFGAIKSTRAMGIEMGALVNQITENQWFVSDRSANYCYQNEALPNVTIVNKAYRPRFCGEYFLTLEEPVPWAWSASYATIEMPCKIVKINALCL